LCRHGWPRRPGWRWPGGLPFLAELRLPQATFVAALSEPDCRTCTPVWNGSRRAIQKVGFPSRPKPAQSGKLAASVAPKGANAFA